jgi:hypothetical protein
MQLLDRLKQKALGVLQAGQNKIAQFKPAVTQLPEPIKQRFPQQELPQFNLGDIGQWLQKEALQPVFRNAPESVMSLSDLLAGEKYKSKPVPVADNPINKFLFGDKPLTSFQQQFPEHRQNTQNFLADVGIDEKYTLPLAIGSMAGVKALDTLPGVDDIVLKAGKTAVKDVLSKAGRGVAKELAEDVAQKTPKFFSKKVNFVADNSGNISPVSNNSKKLKELFAKQEPNVLPSNDQILNLPQGSLTKESTKNLKKLGYSDEAITGIRPNEAVDIIRDQIKPERLSFGRKYSKYTENILEARKAIKGMMGDAYEKYKPVFDSFDESKGAMADMYNKYANRIQTKVPFKAGSLESEMLHKFGENKIGTKELVDRLGQEKAEAIVKADKEFRSAYKDTLSEVNELRAASGLPVIKEKSNYYRHFSEPGFIESFLSGGSRSLSGSGIAKTRKGDKTVYDAVAGFGNYLERAVKYGHVDTQGAKFDTLIKQLKKDRAPRELIDYMENWNKTQIKGDFPELADDVLQKGLNMFDSAGKVIRANKVLGNVGSVASQGLNIPLASVDVGMKATFNGAVNLKSNASFIDSLPFIKERAMSKPTSFIRGITNKSKAVLGGALQSADLATSRTIASMYTEFGKARGFKDKALRDFVNERTRDAMGGRGVGDFSKFQSSRSASWIAPFTVEVQNQMNKLGEFALTGSAYERVMKLSSFFVMTHAINKVWEKAFGYGPMPDPIRTVFDSLDYITGTDEKEQNLVKATGRIVTGIMEFSPIAQNILAFAYPIVEDLAGEDEQGNKRMPSSREIFGTDDPTRFGSAKMYKDAVSIRPLDMVANFSPFGGGQQIKKAVTGADAVNKGFVSSRKSGNAMFSVADDPINSFRAIVSGPYSTREAKEYFDSEFTRPLNKAQTETLKSLPKEDRAEFIRSIQDKSIAKNKVESATKPSTLDRLFGTGSGKTAPDDAVKTKEFGGHDLETAPDATTRNKIYSSASKLLEDDTLPQSYKDKLLEIAKIKPEDMEYYQSTKMANEDKIANLQEIFNNTELSHDEKILMLAINKRTVAGKALLGTSIYEYLYDQGLISKEDKRVLNNLRYDEANNRFYMDRDYKPSTGDSAKTKTLVNKINSATKLDFSSPKSSSSSARSTTVEVFKPPKMPTTNRTRAPRSQSSRKTKDLWFNV